MEYRVYLDSVLIDEPIGLDELEITIEREGDIKGLLVRFTSSLRFIGTGWDALLAKKEDGIATTTECLIQFRTDPMEAWADLFEGIIFTSDVSFNIIRHEATATVEDNSYTAKIANNKSISANFDVGRSKNDEVITPVTTVNIDFYDPVDALGTYKYSNLKCYRAYDCFLFIIDFMSDGTLDFDSSYFDTGGGGEGIYITTGKILSGTKANDELITTFFDLFTELDKRFNLAFRVDITTTPPTVVIEPVNDFYLDTVAVTLDDPNDVIMKFDRSRLYSIVEFGNTVYTDYNTLDNANYPTTPLYGHQDESFHVLGEANLDNQLDLVGGWCVDSNSIEQAVVGTSGTTTGTTGFKLVDSGANFNSSGVVVGMNVYNLTDSTTTTVTAIDSATQLSLAADIFTSGENYKVATRTTFDDNIFIIQTDRPANDRATKNADFEPALGVYLYNVLLNNYNVSLNHFAGIHDSIASYLDADTENARAAILSASAPLVYSSPSTDVIIWDDDTVNGYDTGGNYNTANGRYTVAAGEAGAYTVSCVLDYETVSGIIGNIAQIYIRQYDSGGTLLRQEMIQTVQNGFPIILWAGGTATFYAADGDYFTSEIDWLDSGTIYIKQLSGSPFTPYSSFLVAPVASADIAQVYLPEDFRGVMYDFVYPVSQSEWETINNNLSYKINFTARSETYGGWIEKMVYKHRNKTATITLVNTN